MNGAGKGFIYFMRRADGVGPVKIGCSKAPMSRLKVHQQWSPEALEIVAFVGGTFADEQRLHRQFAKHRLHGEWFEAAPPVLAAMARAATANQLPPAPVNDRNVRIMSRYHAGETLQTIADEIGVSRQRIEQIVRKAGGIARGRVGRRRATVWGKVAQIRAMAETGARLKEIAAAIGESYQGVKIACHKEGIIFVRGRRCISEGVASKAFQVAEEYKSGVSTYEIAKHHDLQQPEIYRLLRYAGVKPDRRVRGKPCIITDEQIAAYRAGATLHDLADQMQVGGGRLRRALAEIGELRTAEESKALRVDRVIAANARRAA